MTNLKTVYIDTSFLSSYFSCQKSTTKNILTKKYQLQNIIVKLAGSAYIAALNSLCWRRSC